MSLRKRRVVTVLAYRSQDPCSDAAITFFTDSLLTVLFRILNMHDSIRVLMAKITYTR